MARGKEAGLATALALAVVAVAMIAAPGVATAKSKLFSSGPINLPIPNNAPTGVFSAIGVGRRER